MNSLLWVNLAISFLWNYSAIKRLQAEYLYFKQQQSLQLQIPTVTSKEFVDK
jgi:hypothetical protein